MDPRNNVPDDGQDFNPEPEEQVTERPRRRGGAGPDDVVDDDSRIPSRRSGDMDRPEMDPAGEGSGEV